MTSTFLGYQLYANDLAQSLAQVDGEAANRSAKSYFEARIGKVKTVDDLIGDYPLFSYVTKAYGLGDMSYAKAFLRKVLTSDLTDPNSIANKLNDSRYRAFARAFNFAPDGALPKPSIQTAAQQTATLAQFESRTAATVSAGTRSAAEAYYKEHIGAVSSVKELERDPKLLATVLTAYGLSTTTPAATVERLLEGDLADPKSLANTTVGAGYAALHAAVNVSATGGVSTTAAPAQSNDDIAETVAAYQAAAAKGTASQKAAKGESTYYANTIAGVTNVDQLLGDSRLVAYLTKAFGLPSTATSTLLRQVLTSDPADPTSAATTVTDPSLKAIGKAFSFAPGGALKPLPFQTVAQQNATAMLYAARQKGDSAALEADTAYYRSHIGTVTTVAQLESDSRLSRYVLTAYGIDPVATPRGTVERVLEEDPSDLTSVVATTPGANALAFATAFSVDATGAAMDPPAAQAADAVTAATAAYLAAAKPDARSQAAAEAETAFYKARIGTVTSIGDLLGDPRTVAYLVKAYGLPAGTAADQLRTILQSGKGSAASLARRYGTGAATLRVAFSFDADGLLSRAARGGVQSASQTLATETLFSRVSLENKAGSSNEGVRLALYFRRVAPTITSAYAILADKAVGQVFQTLLNIPASSAKADIDVQAAYLSRRVSFADLKDPAKVGKLVQRFAAMYDLAHPDQGATDTVSRLFGGSAT